VIATEKREDLEYEKEKQQAYYDVLAASDEQADSTTFIEFMLERIFEAVSSVNTDKLILQYLANNPKATAAQMADFFAYYAKTGALEMGSG